MKVTRPDGTFKVYKTIAEAARCESEVSYRMLRRRLTGESKSMRNGYDVEWVKNGNG